MDHQTAFIIDNALENTYYTIFVENYGMILSSLYKVSQKYSVNKL